MSVAVLAFPAGKLAFFQSPTFELNPSGHAPLAGQVCFSTSLPARAEIEVSDGDRTWQIPTGEEFVPRHEHVILGMRPGRAHTLTVAAVGEYGERIEGGEVFEFETDPLPADFPVFEARVSKPDRMEPGVTVFGIRKSAFSGAKYYGVIVALDAEGEVVWYRDVGHTTGDIIRARNGNIIYLSFDHKAVELDMLGNQVNHWAAARRWPDLHRDGTAVPVDAEGFHHEIFETEDGNFLVLSIEVREYQDYPASETDPNARPRPANAVGDVVVEFNREGRVLNEWKLLDILDPYRFGYDSLGGYWEQKGIPDSCDWSHANAVVHDTRDDSLILSVRHQDAVIKIDRASGRVKWILGTPDSWREPWAGKVLKPEGPLEWQFHQHNSGITPHGTLMLFDNGNYRARPYEKKLPAGKNYSRVVEYDIDEEAMTVRQVWSYGGPGEEAYYCPFICGAEVLPVTGNVLACFGGLLGDEDGGVSEDPGRGIGSARIVEVTHDDDPEVLFELFLDQRDEKKGWDVYRAVRFAGLYG